MFVIVLAYSAVFVIALAWYLRNSNHRLSHIPTVGPSAPLLSYLGALRFMLSAEDVLQEGYAKFKSKPFKIATLSRWLVVLGNTQLIEEMRRAPDDQLSFSEAVTNGLQLKYTLGSNFLDIPYHVAILRNRLTRGLDAIYPEIHDEIVASFGSVAPLIGDEWIKLRAAETVMKIVCRTSNRVFVGLPLCRNEEWLGLCVGIAHEIIKKSIIIRLFPRILQPFVAKLLKGPQNIILRGMKYLQPIVEQRERMIHEYGHNYPEKPDDLLSWFLDEAEGAERTPWNLTMRVLGTNFAAVHTTTLLFTHALYSLAADADKYLKPMRAEVEAIVEKEGWTRVAINEMRTLDSFLKEAARVYGLSPVIMSRQAVQPFTFSDGTYVPPGTTLVSCTSGLHLDSSFYPEGGVFDGFRFSSLQEGSESAAGAHSSLVYTSPIWLAFGYGRHACPGRFFAQVELKTMLAHLVVNYDVKLETGNVRPPNVQLGEILLPNQKANILLRKRRDD